jgi:hypothetical protein
MPKIYGDVVQYTVAQWRGVGGFCTLGFEIRHVKILDLTLRNFKLNVILQVEKDYKSCVIPKRQQPAPLRSCTTSNNSESLRFNS